MTGTRGLDDLTIKYPPESGSWERADPTELGLDPQPIKDAIEFATNHESHIPRDFNGHAEEHGDLLGSLPDRRGDPNGMIVHRGHVVGEWGDVTERAHCFSVAKTILAMITGVAVDSDAIRDVHDLVGAYVDDGGFESDQNSSITWHHLLQGTSEWEGELFGKSDREDRREDHDRNLRSPGEFWEYNDVRVNRLSLSLLRVLGRPLPDVLHDKLLAPIGSSGDWAWYGYDTSTVDLDRKSVVSVPGGGHWGGGIRIRTEDLARLGYLLLRRGQWNGQRLLSESWIDRMTDPCDVNTEYGYLCWLNTDNELWPSTPESSYAALGHGTNVVWIDPTHDLLVVMRWFEREERHDRLDVFLTRLIEAM